MQVVLTVRALREAFEGLCDMFGGARACGQAGDPHPPAPADASGSLPGTHRPTTQGPPEPVVHGPCLVCNRPVLNWFNWIEHPKGNRFWVCDAHHPRSTGGFCTVDPGGRFVLVTEVAVERVAVPTYSQTACLLEEEPETTVVKYARDWSSVYPRPLPLVWP